MSKWNDQDIPDLTDKVIIITGANSGIGFENAKQFAQKNATVIMACRNVEKGEAALVDILTKQSNANVVLMELDLASLKSIKDFTQKFCDHYDRLDILLNNAGIMMVPYRKTVDGFESQNGTNHLGHFALTALLFDKLKETPGSRIINVSSLAHRRGVMDFDNYLYEKGNYDRSLAYGRSKLSNLLFTYELDRRLKAKNMDIKAVASHPGVSMTNLANEMMGKMRYLLLLFYPLVRIMLQSARMGSLPSARAAVDEVIGGEYFGPEKGRKGYPVKVESNKASHNEADARKLWEISEELTGISFEI
ncbi:MAG: SDR family NAD(P)-dependent oxidoreductase [Candidatus Heimdallarchaeota archaeon]|nr:SDR family NAD(P)-dependent oxidoreductase [Candidatus Heimdallarchaeota archaeon]